jgi:ABC-type transport system involved in multi-copper enzyme maturation permease subunit
VTTGISAHRSEAVGHDGFAQLVRAEWTKFRTVRGWVIALGAAALAVVLLSFVSASGDRFTFCPTGPSSCTSKHTAVPTGPAGEPVTDSFTFVHQPLAGNGAVTVRVTSLSGSPVGGGPNGTLRAASRPVLAPWAKAGLIVERDASPGAAYAAVMVTGAHGVRMQYDYTHDAPGLPGAVAVSSPRWLRLTRIGDIITGYDSTDGSHWSEIGTAQLRGLPRAVQIGLFVASPAYFLSGSNNGYPSMATASFNEISVRGDLGTNSWTGEAIGANAFYPALSTASRWHRLSRNAFTITGSGDIAPRVGGAIFSADTGTSILVGAIPGLIVLIVVATLFVTSEYRRGIIRITLTASPRRGRVLAAKAIVVGSVAFAAGLAGTALAEVIAKHVLIANGNYLLPMSGPTEARLIVGTALLLAVAAVLALALGTAFRRSAAAVVTGIVLLVLPFILVHTLPAGASNWLMRLTPTAAFAVQGTQPRSPLVANAYTVTNGYYPLEPWAGLAVLCGYAAIALGAATWLLRRRDV